MKKSVIRFSFFTLTVTLVLIIFFSFTLKGKELYATRAGIEKYINIDFIEVKELEGKKYLYVTLRNESDYYMVTEKLLIEIENYYSNNTHNFNLYFHEEVTNYEKHRFYLKPKEEKVYFAELPDEFKVVENSNSYVTASYFVKVNLYLKNIGDNSVLGLIFEMYMGESLEFDKKIINY